MLLRTKQYPDPLVSSLTWKLHVPCANYQFPNYATSTCLVNFHLGVSQPQIHVFSIHLCNTLANQFGDTLLFNESNKLRVDPFPERHCLLKSVFQNTKTFSFGFNRLMQMSQCYFVRTHVSLELPWARKKHCNIFFQRVYAAGAVRRTWTLRTKDCLSY